MFSRIGPDIFSFGRTRIFSVGNDSFTTTGGSIFGGRLSISYVVDFLSPIESQNTPVLATVM